MQKSSSANSSSSSAVASGGVRKPRKSRGKGLRTTTGCSTCRIRHLKCDEAKPACGPCSKGNRPCAYGPLPATSTASSETGSNSRVHGQSQQSPISRRESALSTQPDPQHRTPADTRWPASPGGAEDPHLTSPQSNYSTSSGYGTEVAPLRWFGLLAGDVTGLPSLEYLGDAAFAQRYQPASDGGFITGTLPWRPTPSLFTTEGVAESQNPSSFMQISAKSPRPPAGASAIVDERKFWQAAKPISLKDHEYDMFQRFVTGISLWIDLFDPLKHFSTLVPHLALRNEGLMKAVLALGCRHLSIKPVSSGEASIDRTASVQYYYETLGYLQSAMQYTSYKNSHELLATVLVVSTYEMIDGAGKGWERHLKGVYWIQRSRDLNGESGGIEQAIWWAWLRQDVWAAFRERRRCFSFFQPTKAYHSMDIWDMASRVVYILAQSVNYASDEEKQAGEKDLTGRIQRANTLLNMLEEWRNSITEHFNPLPVEGPSNRGFRPLWIQPPAFGTSLQMYSMARILLLIYQPSAAGYLEYPERDKIITECIDTIGGIALRLSDDASRLMSTQCLFAAGMYCTDPGERESIADSIRDHSAHTGWPSNANLVEELRAEWSKQK